MQKNGIMKGLLFLLTVVALVAFYSFQLRRRGERRLATQETLDISGKWNSNIGLVYEFTQNGVQFTWFVALNNQKGGGTLSGHNLSASWSDAGGSGSAEGRITAVDENGRAVRIEWDNGVVFERAGAVSILLKPAQTVQVQKVQRLSTLQLTQPVAPQPAAPQPAALAVPQSPGLYLYINGIKGSSQVYMARDWIEIMHFKQSLSSFLAGGSYGSSGGKNASKSPLVITKVVDVASPFLNIYCLTGKLISDVTLVCVSKVKTFDYRIRIESVMISAVEVDGLDEKGRILENISLDFDSCTWEFPNKGPDGSVNNIIIKKFDFKLNKEI